MSCKPMFFNVPVVCQSVNVFSWWYNNTQYIYMQVRWDYHA